MKKFKELIKKQVADEKEKTQKKELKELARKLIDRFEEFEAYFTNVIEQLYISPTSVEYEFYKQSNHKQKALRTTCQNLNGLVIEPFERNFANYQKLKTHLTKILTTDTINSIELLIHRQISNPALEELFDNRQRLIRKRNLSMVDKDDHPLVCIMFLTFGSLASLGVLLPIELSYIAELIKKSKLQHRIHKIDKSLGININKSDHKELIKSYIKVEIAASYAYKLLADPAIQDAALACMTLHQVNRLSNLPKLPQEILNVIVDYAFPADAITDDVQNKRTQFVRNVRDKNLMLLAGRNNLFHHQPDFVNTNVDPDNIPEKAKYGDLAT